MRSRFPRDRFHWAAFLSRFQEFESFEISSAEVKERSRKKERKREAIAREEERGREREEERERCVCVFDG